MIISDDIRKQIDAYPEDFVFTASDFDIEIQNKSALVKMLNRMAQSGYLTKLSKGKFYKPRTTRFGILKPTAYQIAKDFLEKDGKLMGYITGYSAYNALGLTTQISSYIQIGVNKYRRAVKRGDYTLTFIVQPNIIKKSNIDLLRILDAVRFIREIPGTTPDEACKRLKEIFKSLSKNKQIEMVKLALNYTNYVRALCGAVLEDINADTQLWSALFNSLSGISEYKLPISENVLPTKKKWNIV